MRVIGVDPGVHGALVVIDVSDTGARTIVEWHSFERYYNRICGMPLLSIGRVGALVLRVASRHAPILTAIERPIVAPSASTKTVSAWSTGAAAAILASASADAGVEPVFVAPAAWKARFGLVGKDKEYAIDAASQCFERFDVSGPHYFVIAVAEAALVALAALEACRVDSASDND